MPREAIITPAAVRALYNQRITSVTELARALGVSKQAVSRWINDHPEFWTLSQIVNNNFPLRRVPTSEQRDRVYFYLRDHGRWMVTNGEGWTNERLSRLSGWHNKLRNERLIVEYRRGDGFQYRSRVRSDGDLLLRENEFTVYTPEGRELFSLPEN